MIKAFELSLKIGIIPVFSLPHIQHNILSKVETCKKFKDYVQKFDHLEQGVNISKLQIVNVQMFGDKVGFINLRAFTQKDNYKLPNYIFIRGGAVAILMFVNNKILLVEQYRVPIQQTMLEAPAGMIDQSGDFIGVAAAEIQEQTSIKIKKEDLKPIGSYYPSVGGSDEQIFLYYCHINISQQQLKVIEEKIHGKQGERQRIKVKLIDYDPLLILQTKDSKLIYAIYAYENLVKKIQSKI